MNLINKLDSILTEFIRSFSSLEVQVFFLDGAAMQISKFMTRLENRQRSVMLSKINGYYVLFEASGQIWPRSLVKILILS